MRVCRRGWGSVAGLTFLFAVSAIALLSAAPSFGQGTYEARIRGVVTDQSGAVVANATITITNDGTGISQTAHSDEHGEYFFTGLRPSVYTIRAQTSGFRITEKKNVV